MFALGLVLLPISCLSANNIFDIPEDPKDTALHAAAREGNLDELKKLLKYEFLRDSENSLKQTPLHHAIILHKNEVVAFLISDGATLKASAQFFLGEKKFTLTAAPLALWYGNLEAFDKIMARNRGLFKSLIPGIGNLLHLVIASGRFQVFEHLLSEQYIEELKALVNQPNTQGRYPMHYAAGMGDIRAMEILRALGANFEEQDDQLQVPLHMAVRCNKSLSIELLACWEADLKPYDKEELTPLALAQRLKDTNSSSNYDKIIVQLTNIISKKDNNKYENPGLNRGPIENLVLQGSGGWHGSVAQAGALKSLESKKALAKLRRVAGNAYDAVTASLLAVGYSSEELSKLIDNLIDSESQCLGNICGTSENGLREWIDNKLKEKTGKFYLTFGDLKQLVEQNPTQYRHLYLAALEELEESKPKYFNSEDERYSGLIISDVVYSCLAPKSRPHILHEKINNYRQEAEVGWGAHVAAPSEFPTNFFDYVTYWNKQPNEQKGTYPRYNQNTLCIKSYAKGRTAQPSSNIPSQQDKWRTLEIEIDAKDKEMLFDSGSNAANHSLQEQILVYPNFNGESFPNANRTSTSTINPCLYTTKDSDARSDVGKPDEDLGREPTDLQDKLSKVNNIPRLVDHFQQRNVSQDLCNKLQRLESEKSNKVAVFHIIGIPGSGKTELAKDYALKHSKDYSFIRTFNAENTETMQKDFELLAEAIDLENFALLKLETIRDITTRKNKTLQFIERHLKKVPKRWLWIIDNLEEYESIRDYIPKLPDICGTIIITTRSKNHMVSPDDEMLSLDKGMQVSEARELLYTIVDKKISDKSVLNTEESATKLVDYLNKLPLAISVSAIYIRSINRERQQRSIDTPMTFAEYQNLLSDEANKIELDEKQEAKLKEDIGWAYSSCDSPSYNGLGNCKQRIYSQSAAINLLIRQLSKEEQIILELCSFINPNHIPRWILNEYLKSSSSTDKQLSEVKIRSLIDNHPLLSLERYDKNPDEDLFFIHRETQSQMKEILIKQGRHQNQREKFYDTKLKEITVFIAEQFREGFIDYEYNAKEFLLINHLEALQFLVKKYNAFLINKQTMALWDKLAYYHEENKRFEQGFQLLNDVIKKIKQMPSEIKECLESTEEYANIILHVSYSYPYDHNAMAEEAYSIVKRLKGENHVKTLMLLFSLEYVGIHINKEVSTANIINHIQNLIDTKQVVFDNEHELISLKVILFFYYQNLFSNEVDSKKVDDWLRPEELLKDISSYFANKNLYPNGNYLQTVMSNALGDLYCIDGKHHDIPKARSYYKQALEVCEKLQNVMPENWILSNKMDSYRGISISYYNEGVYDQAVKYVEYALKIGKELSVENKKEEQYKQIFLREKYLGVCDTINNFRNITIY